MTFARKLALILIGLTMTVPAVDAGCGGLLSGFRARAAARQQARAERWAARAQYRAYAVAYETYQAPACYSTQAAYAVRYEYRAVASPQTYAAPQRAYSQPQAPSKAGPPIPDPPAKTLPDLPGKTTPQVAPPTGAVPDAGGATSEAAPLPPRVKTASVTVPAPAVIIPPRPRPFLEWLNYHRALHGAPPMVHDEGLAQIASRNNYYQAQARYSGHFLPATHWQVAFYGPQDEVAALNGWLGSWEHGKILLNPSFTRIGLAQSGVAWTANLL